MCHAHHGFFSAVTPMRSESQEVKFPSKPVEMIGPFAPGGITDVGSRIFAESLSRELKVPVVIKNQAGVGANGYDGFPKH